VEPVLAHFLGARAATKLMDHVVDIAITGVWRVTRLKTVRL